MKRLFCFMAAMLILVVPAFAVVKEGEAHAQAQAVDQIAHTVSSVVNSSSAPDSSFPVDPEVSPGGNTFYVLNPPVDAELPPPDPLVEEPVFQGVTVYSVSPIGPEDTTGLKSVLLSLFGPYDPVVVEFEYESQQGYRNYLHEIQPDFIWLCSAAIFALVVYCLFRIGGALLRD